jgi:hypothetical protein
MAITSETNTMRRVPPSPTQSSNGRGFPGRNNSQQMTSSPKAMSVGRSRQNTFSADDGLAPPLDVMTLDEPDVLFDQLERSAQNLTTWLNLLHNDLNGILLSAPEAELPAMTAEEEVLGMPPLHIL